MKVVDSRGKRCPTPIIDCAKELAQIANGESITLLSDDPATLPDLLAWARMSGNVAEQIEKESFRVTKK